ncbi:hypothetical protein GCM10028804_59820 [Larkinella terrae]
MKPIDWPRILADPDDFAQHLPRLDERLNWDALCELCEVDPYKLAGFDRQLMVLIRDFYQMVKRREWEMASAMYDEIVATRERLLKNIGATELKPQLV